MDTKNLCIETKGAELISFFVEIKAIAFKWVKSFNT